MPRKSASAASSAASKDPFEVIGKKPKGIAYQWVQYAIMGDEDAAEPHLKIAKAGGWTYVPPKRHPQMPSEKKQIRVGGNVLMQRRDVLSKAARAREIRAAQAMRSESPMSPEQYGFGDQRKWSASTGTATQPVAFTKQDFDNAVAQLPIRDKKRYCTIPIDVTISDNEIEMALYLKLEPIEYIRRRVAMATDILVREHDLFYRAEFDARIV